MTPDTTCNMTNSLGNDVLLGGSHPLISKTLQPGIFQKIHQCHTEIEKSKLRAKSVVYWTGVYKDTKKIVLESHIYQKYIEFTTKRIQTHDKDKGDHDLYFHESMENTRADIK